MCYTRPRSCRCWIGHGSEMESYRSSERRNVGVWCRRLARLAAAVGLRMPIPELRRTRAVVACLASRAGTPNKTAGPIAETRRRRSEPAPFVLRTRRPLSIRPAYGLYFHGRSRELQYPVALMILSAGSVAPAPRSTSISIGLFHSSFPFPAISLPAPGSASHFSSKLHR